MDAKSQVLAKYPHAFAGKVLPEGFRIYSARAALGAEVLGGSDSTEEAAWEDAAKALAANIVSAGPAPKQQVEAIHPNAVCIGSDGAFETYPHPAAAFHKKGCLGYGTTEESAWKSAAHALFQA